MAYKNNDCVCGFCPSDCGCACHAADSLSCLDIVEAILRVNPNVKTTTFAGFSRNDLFQYIGTLKRPQKSQFQQLISVDPNWVARHKCSRSKSLLVPANVGILGDLLRHDDKKPANKLAKTIKKGKPIKRCVSV
jgi:hypothetical protein